MSGLGGHGEGLRRNRDEAAGAKPGAKPVDRNAVNVGTVHVAVLVVAAASCGSEDRRVVCRRRCAGRSRRSTWRPGKPVTWGRAAVCEPRSVCNG
jgi:hypothetical protein